MSILEAPHSFTMDRLEESFKSQATPGNDES